MEVVFGLPGDGINGIMESLRKQQDKIRFIQVRHEESAAFMACAYAKFTGKLGVCLATSGPGGIHLLNGLYDAKLDGAPVLAITGLQFHDLIDTHAQQDVDLDQLFMDVAVYNDPRHGRRRMWRTSPIWPAARRWPAAWRISISPWTFRTQEVERWHRSKRNVPDHTSDVSARAAGLPLGRDLQRAARF